MKRNRNHQANPQQLIGLAEIMQLAFDGSDLSDLHNELLHRIESNADDAAALLDMAVVLQLRSQPDLALELQWQALQLRQHYRLRTKATNSRLRVLAIMGPGEIMANTPIEFLLQDADVALEFLYVGAGVPPTYDIPKHDVAFVAVCESEQNQSLLRQLSEVMEYWPCPHLNPPARIAELSRERVAQQLKSIAGVKVCDAHRIARPDLANLLKLPGDFPLIARPIDSHAGHGLARLEQPTDVAGYLSEQLQDEFFVAPFVDYCSPDGLYRKYRVTVVDGISYPAHMAVSPRWMVHYLNADMTGNSANRAAEAMFMNTFDWEFSLRHQAALRAIDRRMGLDYYSLDCAETSDGRLLVFEIDSGAVVHAMDPVELFPYKRPHMLKLFSAFRGLVVNTACPRNSLTGRRAAA